MFKVDYFIDITIRPSSAEVPIQEIVNHTIKRLFIAQMDKILPFLDQPGKFSVISKWGCDGSSNHSRFKMPFIDEIDGELQPCDDSHVFLMCMVPLRIYFQKISGCKLTVWNNDLPSSVSFCRPIKMVFQKETAELTRKEVERLKNQINNLNPTKLCIDENEILVTSEMILSMIDGKVLNHLTNTSSQACNICKASGKSLSLRIATPAPNYPLDFAVIPILHSYIRCMEFLLNVAYRIPLRKWRIERGNEVMKERQEIIRGM